MVPLGVYRLTHALREGGGGGVGVGKLPCLGHSVCAALHGRGLWEFNLEKKYLMSLFSILNRVAI